MHPRKNVDPELEQLRNSVEKPPNVDDLLHELSEKYQNIHASFLFTIFGQELLQQLCRRLCATKKSFLYSGWRELAIALEPDPLIPQVIENVNFINQDPVSSLFIAYVQHEDATLIKVILALYKLQRMDIILQVYPLIVEMCNNITEKYGKTQGNKMLKPERIPTPPFILVDLKNQDKLVKDIIKKEQNKLQTAEDKSPTKPKERRYYKIVMLTYCSADVDVAQKVAAILRKERNSKRIGVVLLQDHVDKVNADPETFISDCFNQANYIIPILTRDYLNMLANLTLTSSALDNVDNNYAKYIYTIMTNNYIRRGCINKKIRGIIPDEVYNEVQNHPFMNNSEFRVWIRLSEIEKFADRILTSSI